MCDTMRELQFAEKAARGLLAKTDPQQESLKVLYAQWALAAAKAWREHSCEVCEGEMQPAAAMTRGVELKARG